MRRVALLVTAAMLVACSNETTTAPATIDQVDQFVNAVSSTALTAIGAYDANVYKDRLLNALPDSLKLTSDQQAKIKALVDAYNAAIKADREAFEAVLKEARAAVQAGKSKDEVKAILDKAAPIAGRLADAAAKLKSDIDAVLTQAQRDWLASHQPKRCDKSAFTPLTDAQKAQMKAIEEAFRTTNKADLEAVDSAMRQIKAAISAGKSVTEIQTMFDGIKPALTRLEAARKKLHDDLEAVLTPEQKASGCIPLG